MTSTRLNLLVGLACLGLVVAAARADGVDAAARQSRPDYNSGEYVYRVFCASCHGEHGAGDGAIANVLRVPPANLTSISSRNGGVFPRDRVYAAIDGRQNVSAHGPGQMPVWGDVLKVTEGQNETMITRRINSLVAYIETMQQKAP